MRAEETDTPTALVGAVIARSGKIALCVVGPERWQAIPGYTLIPVELPGGPIDANEAPANAMARHCARLLGRGVHARSSRHSYGPSPTHRIDRLAHDEDDAPYPLLRYQRGALAGDDADGGRVLTTVIRAYLAATKDPLTPSERLAGLLWPTPEALRVAVRDIPCGDIGSLPGGAERLAVRDQPLPDDAFIYVPGELGERHLLRIVAKYGRSVLESEESEYELGV